MKFKFLAYMLVFLVSILAVNANLEDTGDQDGFVPYEDTVDSDPLPDVIVEPIPNSDSDPLPDVIVEPIPNTESKSDDDLVGLPACNPANAAYHYGLAVDYLVKNYPNHGVDFDSWKEFGPCNNMNTQGSTFDVIFYNDNSRVGVVNVNGDTLAVSFSGTPGKDPFFDPIPVFEDNRTMSSDPLPDVIVEPLPTDDSSNESVDLPGLPGERGILDREDWRQMLYPQGCRFDPARTFFFSPFLEAFGYVACVLQ